MLHNSRRVYLDYAAATPVLSEVTRTVRDRFENVYANPSSIHEEGREAKEILEESRKKVASFCGVKSREVIFMSGATEANNTALLGTLKRFSNEGKTPHVISTEIEHKSTLEVLKAYGKDGGTVTLLAPDGGGVISPQGIAKHITESTVLVSVTLVNSEIGVEQQTADIKRVLPEGVLLHVDAVQAPVYRAVNMHSLGADLMTLDAQKMYGPKGVGVLVAKTECIPDPVFFGGGQERGLRPGTENVPLISGFAEAFAYVEAHRKEERIRLKELGEHFKKLLTVEIPEVVLIGNQKNKAPHIFSFALPNVHHEYLAVILDQRGFAIGTGSACAPGEGAISHVFKALGFNQGGIRVSFGRDTKERDLTQFVKTLKAVLTEFDSI